MSKGVIAVAIQRVQALFRLRVIAHRRHAGAIAGVDFIEIGLEQPFTTNLFADVRHIALLPQQFAVFIVDKDQRGEIKRHALGLADGELIVVPLCQREEQIALAAHHAIGIFIEADNVADHGDHAIGK